MVDGGMTHPYFSVIIPVWNRAEMIGRAIDSCLSQDIDDLEVIVIDDGSTDGTAQVVEGYDDRRIVLLRHEKNRGVCPARNTGIAQARGNWLVMLDSDKELLPAALQILHRRTIDTPSDVGNVASSCLWDTGLTTPFPGVPGKPVDYAEYIAWFDTLQVPEWFNCFRKQVFDRILYPESRAYEAILHLGVAKNWRIDVSREVAVMVHTDATNRITASPPKPAMDRLLLDAPDCADTAMLLLKEHGESLRRWGPVTYRNRLNTAALYSFLAGRRGDGIRFSVRALRAEPRDSRLRSTLHSLAILLPGLCSNRLLAYLKAARSYRQARSGYSLGVAEGGIANGKVRQPSKVLSDGSDRTGGSGTVDEG